jgi:hypothetical protein
MKAFHPSHGTVTVQPYNQTIPKFTCPSEKVDVPSMNEIEAAVRENRFHGTQTRSSKSGLQDRSNIVRMFSIDRTRKEYRTEMPYVA